MEMGTLAASVTGPEIWVGSEERSLYRNLKTTDKAEAENLKCCGSISAVPSLSKSWQHLAPGAIAPIQPTTFRKLNKKENWSKGLD